MSNNIKLPSFILDILNKIDNSNYQSFLVGGTIRDFLLNKENNDYDICTNMPFEEVKKIIPNLIVMKENDHRNTGIIRNRNRDIEISFFKGNNIYEDLLKRDFTMNSIAIDKDNNIIDPYNGIEDINNKIIKLVKDDGEGIINDPLRILRAIRFSSMFNFTIDNNLKTQMLDKYKLLNNVATERIYSELIKILTSNNPSKYIREYKEIFFLIIPELEKTYNFDQHNKYHIYDIFEHTMKVIDNTPNNLYIRLAALFHDIGKPETFTIDENNIGHFYNHPKISTDIFISFANKLKIDYKTKHIVKLLIENHERILGIKDKSINKFLSLYGTDNLDLLFMLKTADIKGQNPIYISRLVELDNIKKIYLNKANNHPCISIKDLKIKGNTIINYGYKKQEIGILLKDILDKVLDNKLENNEEVLESYIRNLRK